MSEDGKTITVIAAIGRNGAIGLNGKIPWHLPGELQHFKKMTMGKPIVMGRKTWQAIGRPLPGRQNIVVSRNPQFPADGCEVCGSLEQAVAKAAGDEVMVIGGAELYRQALPLASRIILTQVDCAPAADTWFPDWNRGGWKIIWQRNEAGDEKNPIAYRVEEWVRT